MEYIRQEANRHELRIAHAREETWRFKQNLTLDAINRLSDHTSEDRVADTRRALCWIIEEDEVDLFDELVKAEPAAAYVEGDGDDNDLFFEDVLRHGGGCSLRMAKRILDNYYGDNNTTFLVARLIESEADYNYQGRCPWFRRYKIPILRLLLDGMPTEYIGRDNFLDDALGELEHVEHHTDSGAMVREMTDIILMHYSRKDNKGLMSLLQHWNYVHSLSRPIGSPAAAVGFVSRRLEQGRARILVLFTRSFANKSRVDIDLVCHILSFIEPYNERILKKIFKLLLVVV